MKEDSQKYRGFQAKMREHYSRIKQDPERYAKILEKQRKANLRHALKKRDA